MWYPSKYKICRSTPYTIISNCEKIVTWLTFGWYKPCIGATLCGLLEEWKESRNARGDKGTRN